MFWTCPLSLGTSRMQTWGSGLPEVTEERHFQRVILLIPGPELPFEIAPSLSAWSYRGSRGSWALPPSAQWGGLRHSAGCQLAPTTLLHCQPGSCHSAGPCQSVAPQQNPGSLGTAQGRDSSQQANNGIKTENWSFRNFTNFKNWATHYAFRHNRWLDQIVTSLLIQLSILFDTFLLLPHYERTWTYIFLTTSQILLYFCMTVKEIRYY